MRLLDLSQLSGSRLRIGVRWIIGLIAFVCLSAPVTAQAQRIDFPLVDPPNADGGASEPITYIGNYCGNFGGVSLHDVDSQSFSMDIVGEPVVAYLVWSGRATTGTTTGDDTLEIRVNGGAAVEVTADVALEARSDVNFSWFTYSHNLVGNNMGLIGPGNNTIQVSGLDLPERHGAGLLVLSEDRDRCAFQAIGLLFGNDVLFHNWGPPAGPDSAVACFDFPAPPDPVEIELQMFVGGVENPRRSNAVWFETGAGTPPDSIIGRPTATELVMALRGLSGDEFDNYDTVVQDPRPVFAASGDTWGCVQIESPAQPYAGFDQGISATWINLAARVPVADIGIEPSGINPVGVAHTFTVTVDSSFGFANSLTITPTVVPPPESMSDTCDTPVIAGSVATCTITINSSAPGIFTATAEAEIPLSQVVAFVSTNGVRENSGPAVKEYVRVPAPAIDIEKATNGEDADEPQGPFIVQGETVTWTYEITNIGNVVLVDIQVGDDQGADVSCPVDTLPPDGVMTCTAIGTAVLGQYANIGVVVGTSPSGQKVTDSDPSHYYGNQAPTAIDETDEPDGSESIIYLPYLRL